MLGVRSPAIANAGKHQSLKAVGAEVKIEKIQSKYLRRQRQRDNGRAEVPETTQASTPLDATRPHLCQDRAGPVGRTQAVLGKGDVSLQAYTISLSQDSGNNTTEAVRMQLETNERSPGDDKELDIERKWTRQKRKIELARPSWRV